jgi:hypothetical protein
LGQFEACKHPSPTDDRLARNLQTPSKVIAHTAPKAGTNVALIKIVILKVGRAGLGAMIEQNIARIVYLVSPPLAELSDRILNLLESSRPPLVKGCKSLYIDESYRLVDRNSFFGLLLTENQCFLAENVICNEVRYDLVIPVSLITAVQLKRVISMQPILLITVALDRADLLSHT